MSLQDKVIVITGAASGMGLASAKFLASKGAKLSLADVQEKPLADLEAELKASGAQVMSRKVDVSKRQEVDDWIKATVEKFGKLDGACNLAGVIGRQSNRQGIAEIDDDDWDFVYGVNVHGMKNCLRAQTPVMNKDSSIVNAASILGVIGSAKNLAYSSSKHAVVGMTRTAAKELGPQGIRVNCICPGPIETPMLRESYKVRGGERDYSFLALGRIAQTEEVPPLIEFLLSTNSSFITGNAMQIDGGWFC